MAPSANSAVISAPSLISAMQGGIISIDVGPDRKRFDVYKALLAHHSGYFRNGLKEPWQEAKDGIITLTDVEPAIFAIFAGWCSTTELPPGWEQWLTLRKEVGDRENDITDDKYVTTMVKAYTFGDRFLCPVFQRNALEQLIANFNEKPWPPWFHAIAHAFNNLPGESPLLKVLVDVHCLYYKHNHHLLEDYQDFTSSVPTAFWLATSEKYAKVISKYGQDWWSKKLDPDDYD